MTSPTAGDIGRVVVDPRFRQRRIAVRKQAGRRRLRRLLALIAVAATALSVVLVFESPVLDIDEVTVTGTQHVGAATVTAAAGLDRGAPLLLTDLGDAAGAIEELPWVESAQVTRDLPGEVVVDVTERTPSAVVTVGTARALVDGTGHVLAVGDPADYPDHVAQDPPFVDVVVPETRVEGSGLPTVGDAVPNELLGAIALAGRLRDDPAGSVSAVRLEPTLSFELTGGGTVDLGDDSDLDPKVEAFRTVYARADLTCLDTIDLRVPTHPVITRTPSC